jgi:hypothetical protein
LARHGLCAFSGIENESLKIALHQLRAAKTIMRRHATVWQPPHDVRSSHIR